MVDTQEQRHTLKEWLSEHARSVPIHYKQIAAALQREPSSVSASFSIERKQAYEENRPAYFVRAGQGFYKYNDLCDGVVDEELIKEIQSRAHDFNKATRTELRHEIAQLDLRSFEELVKSILYYVRINVKDAELARRTSNNIMFVTSWLDDSGGSRVLVYAKKSDFDDPVGADVISEIRGSMLINEANHGLLITNGIATDEAKREALGFKSGETKVFVPPVHLMDIEIVLNILLESKIGIRTKNIEILLTNHDFFRKL